MDPPPPSTVPLIFVAVTVGFVFQCLTYGPIASFLGELFAPHVRYSGASLSYQLSAIVVSGGTPFLMTALIADAGSTWPVAVYITLMGLITFVSAWFLPETNPAEVRADPEVRPERRNIRGNHVLDRRFSTDAAGRPHHRPADEPLAARLRVRIQGRDHHVCPQLRFDPWVDRPFETQKILAGPEDAFGEKEARDELLVVAGGTHGRDERPRPRATFRADPDLQGLLDGEDVLALDLPISVARHDPRLLDRLHCLALSRPVAVSEA